MKNKKYLKEEEDKAENNLTYELKRKQSKFGLKRTTTLIKVIDNFKARFVENQDKNTALKGSKRRGSLFEYRLRNRNLDGLNRLDGLKSFSTNLNADSNDNQKVNDANANISNNSFISSQSKDSNNNDENVEDNAFNVRNALKEQINDKTIDYLFKDQDEVIPRKYLSTSELEQLIEDEDSVSELIDYILSGTGILKDDIQNKYQNQRTFQQWQLIRKQTKINIQLKLQQQTILKQHLTTLGIVSQSERLQTFNILENFLLFNIKSKVILNEFNIQETFQQNSCPLQQNETIRQLVCSSIRDLEYFLISLIDKIQKIFDQNNNYSVASRTYNKNEIYSFQEFLNSNLDQIIVHKKYKLANKIICYHKSFKNEQINNTNNQGIIINGLSGMYLEDILPLIYYFKDFSQLQAKDLLKNTSSIGNAEHKSWKYVRSMPLIVMRLIEIISQACKKYYSLQDESDGIVKNLTQIILDHQKNCNHEELYNLQTEKDEYGTNTLDLIRYLNMVILLKNYNIYQMILKFQKCDTNSFDSFQLNSNVYNQFVKYNYEDTQIKSKTSHSQNKILKAKSSISWKTLPEYKITVLEKDYNSQDIQLSNYKEKIGLRLKIDILCFLLLMLLTLWIVWQFQQYQDDTQKVVQCIQSFNEMYGENQNNLPKQERRLKASRNSPNNTDNASLQYNNINDSLTTSFVFCDYWLVQKLSGSNEYNDDIEIFMIKEYQRSVENGEAIEFQQNILQIVQYVLCANGLLTFSKQQSSTLHGTKFLKVSCLGQILDMCGSILLIYVLQICENIDKTLFTAQNRLLITHTLAVFSIIIVIRIHAKLNTWNSLGPVIKGVLLMTTKVSGYLFQLLIVLLAFSFVSYLVLSWNLNQDSQFKTIMRMFESSLGNFDLLRFQLNIDKKSTNENMQIFEAIILSTIWIVFSTFVLVNLIVSLVLKFGDFVSEESLSINNSQMLNKIARYNNPFSSFQSVPIGVNILVLPLLPIAQLLPKQQSQINEIVFAISYFITIFPTILVLFILFEFFLIGYTQILILKTLFVNIIQKEKLTDEAASTSFVNNSYSSKKSQQINKSQIIRTILYLVFGIIFNIARFLLDVKCFIWTILFNNHKEIPNLQNQMFKICNLQFIKHIDNLLTDSFNNFQSPNESKIWRNDYIHMRDQRIYNFELSNLQVSEEHLEQQKIKEGHYDIIIKLFNESREISNKSNLSRYRKNLAVKNVMDSQAIEEMITNTIIQIYDSLSDQNGNINLSSKQQILKQCQENNIQNVSFPVIKNQKSERKDTEDNKAQIDRDYFDERLKNVESKVDNLEEKIDSIEAKIDSIIDLLSKEKKDNANSKSQSSWVANQQSQKDDKANSQKLREEFSISQLKKMNDTLNDMK